MNQSESISSPTLPHEPGGATRHQAWALAAGATVAVLLWTLFVRSSGFGEPFVFPAGEEFALFNPYLLGFGVQEMLIPLALLYGLSRTAVFRRVVTEPQPTQRDRWLLLGLLLGLQVLVFLVRLALVRQAEDQVTVDLLLVLVAGLLGGWRLGLAVGLLAGLLTGLADYLSWGEPFALTSYFEYAVLKNLGAIAPLWVGVIAGLTVPWLGRRRFEPWLTAVLAAGLVGASILLQIYTTGYPPFFIERLLPNMFTFALALAAFALIVRGMQDEAARRDAAAAKLELAQTNLTLTQTRLALAQAELRALHAQINPHFFFNTLNTIRYFVRTNPEEARDLLIRLSEIFQRSLSAGEFVPLRDELSYVEAYLALEKARLDERLKIVWTNLAKAHLDAPVPTLVLQPLVENSIIHGISQQPEGGTLHIVLNQVADDLLVQIDDDGVGFDVARVLAGEANGGLGTTGEKRPSIGLRNVDERLRMLYGEAYRLHIESEPGRGTRIVFKVPLSPPETAGAV